VTGRYLKIYFIVFSLKLSDILNIYYLMFLVSNNFNQGSIMARVKKSVSQKEQELKDIISDTKKKLANLQSKQKMDIGELACSHGLNKFDLKVLDEAFKKLHAQLSHAK
jgi:hypothetical protein